VHRQEGKNYQRFHNPITSQGLLDDKKEKKRGQTQKKIMRCCEITKGKKAKERGITLMVDVIKLKETSPSIKIWAKKPGEESGRVHSPLV